MIESIAVTNHLGSKMTLELSSPEKSGLIVKSITGLGANTNINSSKLATADGEIFNSARMKPRDIVITFIYDESDPEAARLKTYTYFPTKKKVRLDFKTTYSNCYIEGWVEKNEMTIFNKQAYGAITINCLDPYFYSNAINTTYMSGIEPLFEFPFEKDSSDNTTIQMGELRVLKERSVWYTGDHDIGITVNMHLIGPVEQLAIYNVKTREKMSFNDTLIETLTGSKLIALDDIVICTVNGSKIIQLYREGVSYNIINAINRDADWFTLTKGDNLFTYTADVGEYNVQMNIQNRVIYEGI